MKRLFNGEAYRPYRFGHSLSRHCRQIRNISINNNIGYYRYIRHRLSTKTPKISFNFYLEDQHKEI
ncbi:MAG: hypothetical protein LBJ00_16835 [Planctomycetaceae bacterium]|nr:hypothetical protein [Planctomycetaceae bacterium]